MVIIGDEAFALKTYLMKPFPHRQSRNNIILYNYNFRLCRARRVMENVFGILTKKWRIYKGPIEVKENTTVKIILATCILHNYLRIKKQLTLKMQIKMKKILMEHLEFLKLIIEEQQMNLSKFKNASLIFSTHKL